MRTKEAHSPPKLMLDITAVVPAVTVPSPKVSAASAAKANPRTAEQIKTSNRTIDESLKGALHNSLKIEQPRLQKKKKNGIRTRKVHFLFFFFFFFFFIASC